MGHPPDLLLMGTEGAVTEDVMQEPGESFGLRERGH